MNNINPAWQALLNKIPQQFHEAILPDLAQWDQGVQQQLTKYAPFKGFVDNNVDPAWLDAAANFARELEADPTATVSKLNENWNLGFVPKDQVPPLQQQIASTEDDDVFGTNNGQQNQQVDLTQHPAFQQMMQQQQAMLDQWNQQQQAQQEAQQIDAFEKEIDGFLTDKKYVDKIYFTSLRSAGLTNEQALEHFNQFMVNSIGPEWQNKVVTPDTQQTQAPSIMDNNGTVGSGTPTQPVDFGKMGNNDLDSIVEQYLQNSANSGQG